MPRLGAVDVFHLRGHQEMRAMGLSGNFCGLVLALDGRADVAWLAERLARAVGEVPELSWRLSGGLAPVWRRSRARDLPLVLRASDETGALAAHDAAVAAVGESLPGGRTFSLDLLRQRDRDYLILRWLHPFTDAPGAARLCAWLGGDAAAPPADKRFASADRLLPADRRRRHALARAYFRHVMALARRPIVSPHRAAGSKPESWTRGVRLVLDASETASFYRALRGRAQLSDTAVFVWAGARMAERLLLARGAAPEHYLVPVPVALDRHGEKERMFGNHLTMMMFALDRADLADEARAVASIARQRREIIREKLDVGMIAALSVARPLPAALYGWAQRRPFHGERSSFIVSNPGELAIERFGGRAVIDAYTLPTALVPPGFQLIATRHRGKLSIELLFAEGAAGVDEVRRELGLFRADLLGETTVALGA